ncbi:putative exported protein [Halobacteriovorax marinus SJ]|uniref:Exported protein n=1 Tax=Halobacteriovorax marinus (strain ATCC BAA-682 / DSM 15412 / SJ) TaxID=862908 RepID=E1X465_HALMS|nr:hypothetical protein [Halobacteriovorax marinus]CBW27036.1 putative exported protein [Halobacteriovorax marinus SJ]
MKLIISTFLILLSIQYAGASYDCSEVLTDSYSADSKAYRLGEFDVEADFELEGSKFAAQAITKLYDNLGCDQLKGKVAKEVKCSEVAKGVPYSKVCYVENRDGYFLISKDMMENINIIYNRWD